MYFELCELAANPSCFQNYLFSPPINYTHYYTYNVQPGRFGFSSPRSFQQWPRKCRSHYGSLANYFFVHVYWESNPAVLLALILLLLLSLLLFKICLCLHHYEYVT